MAEGIIQLPADGVGKKLRSQELVIGLNTVHQEVITIGGPTGNLMEVDGAGHAQIDIAAVSVTVPISAAALPLPAGAATAANQLPNSHDVTIDNGPAGAAVNIQDGGNTITVDGTVSVDGAVSIETPAGDSAMDEVNDAVRVNVVAGAASGVTHTDSAAFIPAMDDVVPAAGFVNEVLPIILAEAAAGVIRMSPNRNLYVRVRDNAGNERGLNIDPSGNANTVVNNTVTVSGSVTADTELPSASALADNDANPTTSRVGANLLIWDGSTWDRAPGTAADGLLVNLGANNDVTITGTVTVDTELPAAVALTVDDVASPTAPAVGSFPHYFDGTNWDRVRGDQTDGALVNLGTNNDVTITGTVTVDTELPSATALADNDGNPTTSRIGANLLIWDGANWDRAPGTTADGLLVNLGTNNDVTVTGSVTADTELPAATVLADNDGNPTTSRIGANLLIWDGATWDRAPGNSTDGLLVNLGTNNDVIQTTASNLNAQVVGNIAHDSADSGNPVKVGQKAVDFGATPTAVAAGERTDWLANRAGIPWVLGGHPNIITREVTVLDADGAQTDASLLGAIAAGTAVVVTMIDVMASAANTVDVKVRIGFGTTTVPAAALAGVNGVLLSHSKISAGSGVVKGSGHGIVGVGASDQELRMTCDDPVGGALTVTITYFTISI